MDTTTAHFTHLLLGTGQATATLVSGLPEGESIVVVEEGRVGGTCINTGCTPTKTLVASARVAHQARRSAEYGVEVGDVAVDFGAAMARMKRVRGESREGLVGFLEGKENVTLIRGRGRFTGPKTLRVGERTIAADQVYINVGARAVEPPIEGLGDVPWLDNVRILELERRPEHLVIIGASYVALELGQVFARLGSQVTAIEAAPQIIPREDPDVAAEVRAIVEGDGVRIEVGSKVERVAPDGDGVAVTLEGGEVVRGSHLLVATGRRPNTDGLGLDEAGIETDDRGYVVVDDHTRSSAEGVYALGDVNGRGAFTHTSVNDAQVLLDHLNGGPRKLSDRDTIYALYTDPPLGRVGLTEAQARERGGPVLRASMPMSRVARANEMGETQGVVKVLVDADTDLILGASVLGVHGDEVVGLFALAMSAGITTAQFRQVVLPHPTVGELMPFVFDGLEPLD